MDQDELLRRVVGTLEALDIPYLVTGSMATIVYGEPRFTNDIDVVVQLRFEDVDRLLGEFSAEDFYVSPESARRAVARSGQFNLIHPRSGLKVDFMVAAMDAFDRSRFRRARSIQLAEGPVAKFASPEDVIVKKLVYYREGGSEKHLRDAAGVLQITTALDRDYVAEWAERLGVAEAWRFVEKRSSGP